MAFSALIIDVSIVVRENLARLAAGLGLFEQVFSCSSEEEARACLERQQIDLILWDWRPETVTSGQNFFRALRALEKGEDIPIFLLMDGLDEEMQLLSLESGADDCHPYPRSHPGSTRPDHRQLAARLRLHLRRREATVGLRAENRSLARKVVADPLTGLYNRGFFEAALRMEIARCNRNRDPFSLLLIDLDHFKAINDRFGHCAGDRVLEEVASVLRGATRASDMVCRYGGEEFAVILPGTPAEAACQVAERIRQHICQPNRLHLRGLRMSASIGISGYDATRAVTAEQLVEEADLALYAGKRNGRNRIEFYSPASTSVSQPSPDDGRVNPWWAGEGGGGWWDGESLPLSLSCRQAPE